MGDLNAMFGGFITEHLQAEREIPHKLQQLLELSTVRLLDSEIIIEDKLSPRAPLGEPRVSQPLPSFEQTFVIDELCEAVKIDGFGKHFHQIIGLFGSIMLQLTATEKQMNDINQWLEQGYFGHFLMTDAGGPALANWQTVLNDDGELSIAKKWGIEAHDLGFVMLVTRQGNKPFPVTALLTPEQCQQLNAKKVGTPYLDGSVQLGDVTGTVTIDKSQLLSRGGMGAVNRFLTLVRPRFVKSLMNHLCYLRDNDRLSVDQDTQSAIDFIGDAADMCLAQKIFSMHSVDKVLALKFASNELLLELVAQGKVAQLQDARDLLGMSKMEGSSYRCFFEIYSKQKRGRR